MPDRPNQLRVNSMQWTAAVFNSVDSMKSVVACDQRSWQVLFTSLIRTKTSLRFRMNSRKLHLTNFKRPLQTCGVANKDKRWHVYSITIWSCARRLVPVSPRSNAQPIMPLNRCWFLAISVQTASLSSISLLLPLIHSSDRQVQLTKHSVIPTRR